MCKFTRQEFVQGCRALKADSIRSLQLRLPEAVSELISRPDLFKSLYRFTFRFGLASSAYQAVTAPISGLPHPRSLPIDMALILWQLIFSQREPPILAKWLHSHQVQQPVQGISSDSWDMFLPFALTVDGDLSGYDDSEA